MTYRFLAGARADLDAVAVWYESRLPGLGDDFTDEVYDTVQRILAFPHGHAPIAAPSGREVRGAVVRRFNYVVIHEVLPNEVVIAAVRHPRSNSRAWRRRLP